MSEVATKQRPGYGGLLLIVLLSVAGLVAVVQFGFKPFGGGPSRSIKAIILLGNVAAYAWIRKYSRLGRRGQVVAVVLILLLQLSFRAAIRIDGFMGDGRPIVAWSWEPTADDLFASGHRKLAPTAGPSPNQDSLVRADWVGFRNKDRSGRIDDVLIARDVKANAPVELWRRPVGRGWSSFIVVGDRCITQEQQGESEVVVCYNVLTGEELWVHADQIAFREVTGGDGPRATPASDGERVVALGATGVLNCLNLEDGTKHWSVQLSMPPREELVFGAAGSPLILDQTVIVTPGGEGNAMVALDLGTGDELWAVGDSTIGYSSPHHAKFNCGPQLLTFGSTGIVGHDPNTGSVLWSAPFGERSTEFVNVCQPVPLTTREHDRVLISAGYGRGCEMLELTSDGNSVRATTLWKNLKLKSKFASIVTSGNCAYGLDERILTCIDLDSGERLWKGGRYGHGQLILAGDTLIVLAENGDVVLVEASSTAFNQLSRFKALESRTWTHPVLAGSLLLVRNDREAVCYALKMRK